MGFEVHHGYSRSEEEAIAQLRSEGLRTVLSDVEAVDRGAHFHGFASSTVIVAGVLEFTDLATGISHHCPAGTRIDDSGRNLHTECHDNYRAVVAFAFDPRTIEPPIVRWPDEL